MPRIKGNEDNEREQREKHPVAPWMTVFGPLENLDIHEWDFVLVIESCPECGSYLLRKECALDARKSRWIRLACRDCGYATDAVNI
jgi:hypothetical protein